MGELSGNSSEFAVGGDFANVFDANDYLSMVNATDESVLLLRAHLILEEFLNIWAAKTTQTVDLFAGPFISFRTKLQISKNLGLPDDLYEVLDRFNTLRNDFSHRRKHKLGASKIESLCSRIDALSLSQRSFTSCRVFEIWANGVSVDGTPRQVSCTWATADLNRRLLIIFVVFVMKFVIWMQGEFKNRGIAYSLVTSPLQGMPWYALTTRSSAAVTDKVPVVRVCARRAQLKR